MPDHSVRTVEAAIANPPPDDPYVWVRRETVAHRARHGCGAYTFTDGPLLIALARHLRPRRVLELGTALGYTACCWADAGATVDSVEIDPTHVAAATANIARAAPAGRVTVHEGAFDDVLPELPASYDAAFFDGFTPTPSLLDVMFGRLHRPAVVVVANLHMAGPDVLDAVSRSPGTSVVTGGHDVAVIAVE